MQARYKAPVSFDTQAPAGVSSEYVSPQAGDYGTSCPLKIGYAAEWEDDLVPMLDIIEQAGFPINPDHNSGDPLGRAVLISSASKGLRSTAQDLLVSRYDNLTILTKSAVQRIILEGKKAVGV
jgi:choline dehydrogenase-like flavoprotein